MAQQVAQACVCLLRVHKGLTAGSVLLVGKLYCCFPVCSYAFSCTTGIAYAVITQFFFSPRQSSYVSGRVSISLDPDSSVADEEAEKAVTNLAKKANIYQY